MKKLKQKAIAFTCGITLLGATSLNANNSADEIVANDLCFEIAVNYVQSQDWITDGHEAIRILTDTYNQCLEW